MKPGLTARRGQVKMAPCRKPGKVGSAHNKDMGYKRRQEERDIEAEMRRRSMASAPSDYTDVEKDAFRRGVSTEAVDRAREANMANLGVSDPKKYKRRKR